MERKNDMSKLTYFIVNPKVKEILELSDRLRECLKYPNSENSNDERRYSEHFEAKILEVMKRKGTK
jgi:hypothetical protein